MRKTRSYSNIERNNWNYGEHLGHAQADFPLILLLFFQPARTKQGSHGLGRTIINRKAKEAKVDRKTLKYTEEAENLRSVTHERDLDEFLNNASLADADFTAGAYLESTACARDTDHVVSRSSYGKCQGDHDGIHPHESTEECFPSFR